MNYLVNAFKQKILWSITYSKRWSPTNMVDDAGVKRTEVDERVWRQIKVCDQGRYGIEIGWKCIQYNVINIILAGRDVTYSFIIYLSLKT